MEHKHSKYYFFEGTTGDLHFCFSAIIPITKCDHIAVLSYLSENNKMCWYRKFYFIMILFMNDAVIDVKTNDIAIDPFCQVTVNVFYPRFDKITPNRFYVSVTHFINHAIELG